MSLSSLPLELLLFIPPNLQYASELNAMSQTCRLFHTIFNPQLYSIFANSCELNILRLVETGNSKAIRKLLSTGYKLFDFMQTQQFWWEEREIYMDMQKNLKSRSSMIIAAANGHLEILQIFIENLPSIISRSPFRSWHLLSYAAMRGQLDVVKFLIAQGVPVDTIHPRGVALSVLNSAVTGGYFPVFKYIIEETACKDQLQESADYLLCCATREGHFEIVKYLVKCGTDFTSAFDIAMNQGQEDMALFFLDNVPPELLDAMTISGWESMLRSCERDAYLRSLPSPWRNPQIAQIILDKVNLKTNLATTTALERANLLAVAAETGNMSLTQLLLDRGCRPILSQMLHTPVSRAVNNGHAKIIETFLRCPDYPVSQLDVASAAEKGETTTVLTLLKKVKRKDFKSFAQVALNAASYPDKFVPMMEDVFLDVLTKKDTMTLVSMAISSNGPQISRLGHLEAMKFLLEKGDKQPFDKIPYYFEIIRRRSKGSTSFLEHAAAVCPVTQFQAALAQWNLVLDPENDLCKAALVAAALLKKVEILQLFIDKGFDVNSSYLHRGKFSPLLHLVVETLEDENGEVIGVDDEHARIRQPKQPKRHPWLDHIHPHASIQLLIEHGAKIDQVDSNGRTALFLTTERRTLFLTKELLRLGANPVLSGPGKPSPLELAISQGQPKYVKAFLEAMEARSIVCDNFVSLIPDSLPVETLPNRASGERFSVPSGYRLSQRRMLARDGQMGPTKTLPAPCAEAPRQPTLSWEDISTDEEIWREGLRNSEDNLISIWSPTEDDDCISDLRWVRFFITKAMTQYHWRTMYPVPV